MFIQYTEEGKGTLICSEKSLELLMKEVLKDIEYNTDTSTGHPVKDDDIVQYSEKTQRVQDKELEY